METGFVRPGETGFTQIETGFVELAKPVSGNGFAMGVGAEYRATGRPRSSRSVLSEANLIFYHR